MKVGIIVSRNFFDHHVGVRNYILGLGAFLAERARVDYLARLPNEGGSVQWYAMQPLPPRYADPTTGGSDRFEGKPQEVFQKYLARGQKPAVEPPPMPHLAVGSDLAVERYDTLIVSSPWAVEFDARLPARRVIGVAFDTIPNTIGFTTWGTRPFAFAGEHARGYRYFREHADAVYAISRDTADSLTSLFGIPAGKLTVIPPFLPAGYAGKSPPDIARGPNVVLAAPFDPRKGLDELPALINPSAAALGRLGIYGQPRCQIELVQKFFAELDPSVRVEWHPRATTDEVMTLFASSRLLLFPSTREGLGIPLLEAQVCGARVAARPIPPMADNMLTGAVPLGASVAENAARIAAAVADDAFDHPALCRQATAHFTPDRVRSVLFATAGDAPRVTPPPRADQPHTGAADGFPFGPADRQFAGDRAPGGAAAESVPRAGADDAAAGAGR